jgi:hypothetical protein
LEEGCKIPIAKPEKIVLEEYQIWLDKDLEFDKSAITSIKSPEYNFWGEVKKTRPRCKRFEDGTRGDSCAWYVARVVTDTPKELLVPEAVFRARTELMRVLDSMPEYVSFRGEDIRPFD